MEDSSTKEQNLGFPDGRQQEPGGWNRIVVKVQDLPARIAELTQSTLPHLDLQKLYWQYSQSLPLARRLEGIIVQS